MSSDTQNQPDIQYLRVLHTGKTTGSIYLSDLDTEQNTSQNSKIPVYVQERDELELPLNDNVLLSYSQGSIRRHISDGRLKAHIISDDESQEIWVSNTGDDDNTGTRTAPVRSIQVAQEKIFERAGSEQLKVVHIVEDAPDGERHFFKGPILVNTPRWQFIGHRKDHYEDRGPFVVMDPEGAGYTNNNSYPENQPTKPGPAIAVFPWTMEEYWDFIEEGGFSAEISGGFRGTGTFEYTGPEHKEREWNPEILDSSSGFFSEDFAVYNARVHFKNLNIWTASPNKDINGENNWVSLGTMCGPPKEYPNAANSIGSVKFTNVRQFDYESGHNGVITYFKNGYGFEFDGFCPRGTKTVVFDNTFSNDWRLNDNTDNWYSENLSVVFSSDPDSGRDTSRRDARFNHVTNTHGMMCFRSFRGFSSWDREDLIDAHRGHDGPNVGFQILHLRGSLELNGTFGHQYENVYSSLFCSRLLNYDHGPFTGYDVRCSHTVEWTSEDLLHVSSLVVGYSMNMSRGEAHIGSGAVGHRLSELDGGQASRFSDGFVAEMLNMTFNDDVIVEDADTVFELKNGTIAGSLDVSGPATILLTNVTVEGNVEIGENVEQIIWRGGSFHGDLIDPSSKMGAVESGDYLNVDTTTN